MKYYFEKKILDRGIMKIRFNINYWLLKAFGLNGLSFFAFLWGVLVTIIVYKFILQLMNTEVYYNYCLSLNGTKKEMPFDKKYLF